MVSIAYALLGAWLVAMTAVSGAPIESDPVSISEYDRTINWRSSAHGTGKVPSYAMKYKIPKEAKVLTRSEARLAATGNDTDSRRALETLSTDVQLLEEAFGVPMERNVDTLLTGIYRAASAVPIPWPGSYWPSYGDGINYRWAGSNIPSASEKYATAFGLNVAAFTKAISESNGILSNSGNKVCKRTSDCTSLNDGSICGIRRGARSGYCIPGWWGICHAWAPAAILEQEPRCAVTKGSTTFQPFDIKALLTQIYDGANIGIVFTGSRFNGPDYPEDFDEYGRYKDAARRDISAGFFHIAITNILARFKRDCIVDVAAGSQVWNQPVRDYEVLETKELTPAQAASQYFGVAQYPFNAAAEKLVYVKTRLRWMNEGYEDGPIIENGHADAYTQSYDQEYLLEIDAQRQITGGEWLSSSNSHHPDFLWFPANRPDPSTITSVGLSYANVLKLLDASIKCTNLA